MGNGEYVVDINKEEFILKLPKLVDTTKEILLRLKSLNPNPIFEYNIKENKIFKEVSFFLDNKIIEGYSFLKDIIDEIELLDFAFESNENLNIKDDFTNFIFFQNENNIIIPVKNDEQKSFIILNRDDKKGFQIVFLLNECYYLKVILNKNKNGIYYMNFKSNFKHYLIELKRRYENRDFNLEKYREKIKVLFTYEQESNSFKI